MTALAWVRAGCRVVALALCAWVVLTGWRPTVETWRALSVAFARHDLVIEFRPRALLVEPLERWT